MLLVKVQREGVGQVVSEPLCFGDPFHSDNLAVSGGSLAAFGQTDKEKPDKVHHRQ